MNLHILTYNVFGMPWGNQSIESVLLWAFLKTDAEILCFQEVFSESHRKVIEDICARPGSQWTYWFPQTESTYLSRWLSSFSSVTGLCVLIKKTIHVLQEPTFHTFQHVANVDRWVRKGFFHIYCEKDNQTFHLLTTHFQSDFTECKCNIRYENVRQKQENELFAYCKHLQNVVLIGDFNTSSFRHFRVVNQNIEPTFPSTGETLDHCLCLPGSSLDCLSSTYYHDVSLSDHIPVSFKLRLGKA